MIENLKRIREPLAWALIVLVVANLGLGIVQLVGQVQQAVPLFEAFQTIGGSLLNISVVIALVAVVCTCFFIAPATRRAHGVTLAAAIVLSLGVLLTLVSYGFGAAAADNAFGRVLEIIGGLLDLLLKALAAGSLWVLLRGVRAGRIDTAPAAVQPVVEEAALRNCPPPPSPAPPGSGERPRALPGGRPTRPRAGHPGRPGSPAASRTRSSATTSPPNRAALRTPGVTRAGDPPRGCRMVAQRG